MESINIKVFSKYGYIGLPYIDISVFIIIAIITFFIVKKLDKKLRTNPVLNMYWYIWFFMWFLNLVSHLQSDMKTYILYNLGDTQVLSSKNGLYIQKKERLLDDWKKIEGCQKLEKCIEDADKIQMVSVYD